MQIVIHKVTYLLKKIWQGRSMVKVKTAQKCQMFKTKTSYLKNLFYKKIQVGNMKILTSSTTISAKFYK